MKRIISIVLLSIIVGSVLVSCEVDDKKKQSDAEPRVSANRQIGTLLYQTIYDFTKMMDSTSNNKWLNILGVYSEKCEDGEYIILAVVPSYSHDNNFAVDSLVISHAVVNDWLVCLYLRPKVFNEYKSSFTFIDPNQYPQYRKHYEGCFEPVSWYYRFQNDSLVFVKRVCH